MIIACVVVEYQTLDILLHAESEQKRIGNQFCTPIIFKNPLKTWVSLKNILITICVGCVWIVICIYYYKNKLLIDY